MRNFLDEALQFSVISICKYNIRLSRIVSRPREVFIMNKSTELLENIWSFRKHELITPLNSFI